MPRDTHFPGFRGCVRREALDFSVTYRVASGHDPWETPTLPPNRGIQFVTVASARPHTQAPALSVPLLVQGTVTDTGSPGDATEDWASQLVALSALLDRDGSEVLAGWDGSFSLACFFPHRRQLFLYRSLMNDSSLYYRSDSDTFAWSTNPLDLVPGGHNLLDDVDVDLLPILTTAENYPATRSCFRRLHRLPSGHLLVVDAGTITVRRVAELGPMDLGRPSTAEAADLARGQVLAAARRWIAPGQPLAVLVSGGIDSAVLAYVARAAGAEVTAFHWSFAGYGPADEGHYADLVIRHLNLPRVDLPVARDAATGGRRIQSDWPLLVPGGPYVTWHRESAAAAAERGIQTVADGMFGDLVFGATNTPDLRSLLSGMPPLTALTYAREFLGTYVPMDRVRAASLAPRQRRFARFVASRFETFAERFLTSRALAQLRESTPDVEPRDDRNPMLRGLLHQITRMQNDETAGADNLNTFLLRGTRLVHLLFDRQLMEFGLGLPPGYRWFPAGGQFYQKAILRLAFAEFLPPEIVRRNFRTYLLGIDEVYCRNNRVFITDLLGKDSFLAQLGVVEPGGISDLMASIEQVPDASSPVLRVALVEVWLRALARGRTAAHAAT